VTQTAGDHLELVVLRRANAGYRKGGVLLAASTTAMRLTFDRGTLLLAQEGDDVNLVDMPWIL
jgi:hypothetical protein